MRLEWEILPMRVPETNRLHHWLALGTVDGVQVAVLRSRFKFWLKVKVTARTWGLR